MWLALLLPVAAPVQAVERVVPLTSFDRIRVDGPFDVVIEDGTTSRATVSGDSRTLDRLSLRIDSGLLVVGTGGSAWGQGQGVMPARLRLRIVTPPLRAARVNGSGTLSIARMRAAKVDIVLNGAGSIEVAAIQAEDAQTALTGTGTIRLAGKVRRARLSSTGAGALDAAGLAADEVTLVTESMGPSAAHARYSASILALGRGAVSISGPANCDARGPGEVNCGGKLSRHP